MVALLPVLGLLALTATSTALGINDVDLVWYNNPNDPSAACNEGQRQIILEEFGVALDAAQTAYESWKADSNYAKALFPQALTDNTEFYTRIRNRLYALPLSPFEREAFGLFLTWWDVVLQGKGGNGYGKDGKPLCPKEGDAQKEGPCKAGESEYNADTYKYLITGLYFEKKCGKPIPFSPIQQRSLDFRRDTSCPAPSNPDIIDPGPLPGKVNGYVRFGDSYASGLGAGTTSQDGCRVGSNNYGNLLVQHFNQNGLDYQQLSCSGDTLDGLAGQIDKWSNQNIATFGTLTIGGNDLGFSDLVANCVITPFTWRGGSANRASCLDVQNKARGYLQDSSDNGLRANLKNAYLKIMQKSTLPGFQLYVTGYPTFFNADTDTCDYSSFHLWWGGYNPSSDWPSYRTTFLTKALRAELNDLVAQLNSCILGAVQDANAAFGGNQVHFVDVVGAFEGHRWCEGSTKEPDQANSNTFFLLSNWADSAGNSNKKARSLDTRGQRDYSSQLLMEPPARTTSAPTQTLQLFKLGITKDPNGPAAHLLGTSKAYGNYSHATLTVSRFSPTWLIETFHPRTSGMKAYRDAIIHAMQQTGFSV
ncbi:hypothetical protein ACCO45_002693 [Purpureocillium lilacinum]|uniref:Uncharacterized protein n=1 Tax=Purpureocillium lilacinum TaxID=33203 RepID=A0ACC4EAL2_PURLI